MAAAGAPFPADFKYCPHCGARLEKAEVEEAKIRDYCSECGWVHYLNPIPVVVCVAYNRDREFILIRRNIEPARGEWARRELKEETGLEAIPGELLGLYNHRTDYYGELLVIAYAAEITGGSFEIDKKELQAARFVTPDTVPPIPFKSHRDAIKKYARLSA